MHVYIMNIKTQNQQIEDFARGFILTRVRWI